MEADREELALLTDEDFTTLGGLQKIRWSPSQYRALYKLDKNYKNVTQHTENVAATGNHERKEECEGVLSIVTSLKFLKIMMFLIDLHRVLKFLSLQFQRNDILIIEVEPLLNKTFMALQNLRGGKGMKMLEFSDDFESTGMYKGVKLNRTRHLTRSKTQARMEQFSNENRTENACITSELFSSYNFYVDYVIQALKERFSVLFEEPFSFFRIFDYQMWLEENTPDFLLYGDTELASLLARFKHMYSAKEMRLAKIEWLPFKAAAVAKVQQFRATLSLPAMQESEEENDSYPDDNIHPPLLTPNVPGQISAAELCFAMYRDQSTLGVVHICLVLTQMIAMSPSNAHTERQIKAMNNIKTIHRTTLGQAKLNNQYKIAMNSLPPKLFDPQPVIDHYVRKSTESLDKQ